MTGCLIASLGNWTRKYDQFSSKSVRQKLTRLEGEEWAILDRLVCILRNSDEVRDHDGTMGGEIGQIVELAQEYHKAYHRRIHNVAWAIDTGFVEKEEK